MAQKPVRGRPTIPDSEKRVGRFLLKLSDAEYAMIKKAAVGKVSTWARDTLIRAAKRA